MISDFFNIDPYIQDLAVKAEKKCKEPFERIDEIAEYNACKVLASFIENGVSESHFTESTGYGYGDRGREVLDKVFAQAIGAQDALVRHNFVCGTHAITTALFGLLRPGDLMVSLAGKPYDTLEEVIGIRESSGSLREFGVKYKMLDLLPDATPDFDGIADAVQGAKVAHIQRSRGYSLRESLSISQLEKMINLAKQANPDIIVFVDNCYGEFVEKKEPTQVGADIMAGSLIKNPGGGIAKTGGYIAGRHDLVEECSYRLTCPGAGREVGCTLGENRSMFLGLFHAPTVTASAVKTAVFTAALFDMLGYPVYPAYDYPRTDIIQAVELGSEKGLTAFCQGVQKGAPIDAFVVPEAWDMPGYESKVIMAAGAFTLGASIELSADGPMRQPYAAWLQGGITYPSGKTGVVLAAQSMLEQNLIKKP